MNGILVHIELTLTVIKILTLIVLGAFGKDSIRAMILNRPESGSVEQFEHSLFVFVFTSMVFQLIAIVIRDVIYTLDVGVQAVRQIFYIGFSIHEGLFMVAVIQWHNFKRCNFAKITTYGFYVSGMLVILLMSRYVDRVVFGTDVLKVIYTQIVVLTNVFMCLLMAAYPMQKLLQFITFKFKPSSRQSGD
ncbi:hypothetical protein [Pseudoalteromonas byunsanensis]|uniref:Uncharacterized protein n=1 Tax=Pseudoalteromonas byunsanensis TaxID=327939 RepID=A0A1S1ND84_9GAMM|nr:hypothetical protein [Pseudoalteromonas byunsanensis]OHU97421.1 hypothetical protein BIW53_02030 [Pseudoalteromonas byunsanensis]OHU97821.1 hypothetical protein BIW53_00690 [Pseudoalteromonas byunsanensis]